MDNPEKLATLGIQVTRRRQTKKTKNNATCVGQYCTETNTNNVHKT